MRALGVDTKVRMIELGAMRNVVQLLPTNLAYVIETNPSNLVPIN
jgi:hypothetical protein